MAIKRILVPIDFSEGSLQALDYAIEFGKPLGARLTVLLVLEPIQFSNPGELYAPSANLGMLLDERRQAARDNMARLERDLRKRRVEASTTIREGLPHEEILAAADASHADVVVMSTHGRTGVSHLLLGSVTEKVIRYAKCPVLTLHGYDKGTRKRTRKG